MQTCLDHHNQPPSQPCLTPTIPVALSPAARHFWVLLSTTKAPQLETMSDPCLHIGWECQRGATRKLLLGCHGDVSCRMMMHDRMCNVFLFEIFWNVDRHTLYYIVLHCTFIIYIHTHILHMTYIILHYAYIIYIYHIHRIYHIHISYTSIIYIYIYHIHRSYS